MLYKIFEKLGSFKEYSTKTPWKELIEGIDNIRKIIKDSVGEDIKYEEINAFLYPILLDFFDTAFEEARKCGMEPPSSYKELYENLKKELSTK